jgi:hypothetical protein
LIITAMLLFAVVCRWDARWSDFRAIAAVLAIVAAVAGAFSPFAGLTTWSGLAQRLLGLTVVTWLLLCAWHIRFGTLRRRSRPIGRDPNPDDPALERRAR